MMGNPSGMQKLAAPERWTSKGEDPEERYRRIFDFEKNCRGFGYEYVDIYWLHLPNHIEENLAEMIELHRKGRIGHISISNFNLATGRKMGKGGIQNTRKNPFAHFAPSCWQARCF